MDWFNAVDLTYQQQLRDLNDLNWERFKAEMDARFSQVGARVDARFAQVDVQFAQFEARLIEKFTEKLADTKGELMKWMFIYWSGTVLSLGGLMIALLRK